MQCYNIDYFFDIINMGILDISINTQDFGISGKLIWVNDLKWSKTQDLRLGGNSPFNIQNLYFNFVHVLLSSIIF